MTISLYYNYLNEVFSETKFAIMTQYTLITSDMILNSQTYLKDNSKITEPDDAWKRYNSPLIYMLRDRTTNFESITEFRKLTDRKSRQDNFDRTSVRAWLSDKVSTLDDLLLENEDYLLMMSNNARLRSDTLEATLTNFSIFCLGCNSRAIRLFWIITLYQQLKNILSNNVNMQMTYKYAYQVYKSLQEILKEIKPKTVNEFFEKCETWWISLSDSGNEFWPIILENDFFLKVSIPNVLNVVNGSVIHYFMKQVETEVSDTLLGITESNLNIGDDISMFTIDVEITGAKVEITDKKMIMYSVPLPLRPFFNSMLLLNEESPYYKYLALCLSVTSNHGYVCDYQNFYDDLKLLVNCVKPFNPSDISKVTTMGQFAIHCLSYNSIVPITQFAKLKDSKRWLRLTSVLRGRTQDMVRHGSKWERKLMENHIPVYFTGDKEDNISYERLRSNNKLSQFLDVYKLNVQLNSYKSFLKNFFLVVSCNDSMVTISVSRRNNPIPFISFQRASCLKEFLEVIKNYDPKIPNDINGLKCLVLSYKLVEFLEYFRNSSYSWIFTEESYNQFIKNTSKVSTSLEPPSFTENVKNQLTQIIDIDTSELFEHAFDIGADVLDESALLELNDYIYAEEETEGSELYQGNEILTTDNFVITNINVEDIQIKGIYYCTEFGNLTLEAKPIYHGITSHLRPVTLRELSVKRTSVNNGDISIKHISYGYDEKPKIKLGLTYNEFKHKISKKSLSDRSKLIYSQEFTSYLGESLRYRPNEIFNLDDLLKLLKGTTDYDLENNYRMNRKSVDQIIAYIITLVGDNRYVENNKVTSLKKSSWSWFLDFIILYRYTSRSKLIIRLMTLLRISPDGQVTTSGLYLYNSILDLLIILFKDEPMLSIKTLKQFNDLLISLFSTDIGKLSDNMLHTFEHLPSGDEVPGHYIIARNVIIGPDIVYQDSCADVLTTLSTVRFQDLPIDAIYFGLDYILVVVKKTGYLLLGQGKNTGWISYINFPIIEKVYAVIKTDMEALLGRYKPNYIYDVIWLADMSYEPVVIKHRHSKLQKVWVDNSNYKFDAFSLDFEIINPRELQVKASIKLLMNSKGNIVEKCMSRGFIVEVDESMFHTLCKILIIIAFKLLYNIDCKCSYNNGQKILDLAFKGDIAYTTSGFNLIEEKDRTVTIEIKTSRSINALKSMCTSGNALHSDILFGISYDQKDASDGNLSLNSFTVIRRREEKLYSREVSKLLKIMLIEFNRYSPKFSSQLAKNSEVVDSVLASKSQFKFNDLNGLFEVKNNYEPDDHVTKLRLEDHVLNQLEEKPKKSTVSGVQKTNKLSDEDKLISDLLQLAYGSGGNKDLKLEFDKLENELTESEIPNECWDSMMCDLGNRYLGYSKTEEHQVYEDTDDDDKREQLLDELFRRRL